MSVPLTSSGWRYFTTFLIATVVSFVYYAIAPSASGGWNIQLLKVAYPLVIGFLLTRIFEAQHKIDISLRIASSYVLFFSISVISLLGMAQPLTGSHAVTTNPAIHGLSFYSALLAYLIFHNRLSRNTFYIAANPILLFTGPIPFRTYLIRCSLKRRLKHYFPFVIVGIFMFGVVASPLTYYFEIIELTDPINTIAFAIIFELFVYFNFAGLSLFVYGVAGIVGLRVPLNFRQPFSSRNLIEFWKGWHVSLSAVLKELFYRPTRRVLGTEAALLVVFLSSAMWHGVTVNFLLWGVFHAICYIITIRMLRCRRVRAATLLLLVAVVIGRILFSDADTERLLSKLSLSYESIDLTLVSSAPSGTSNSLALAFILVGIEFFMMKNSVVSRRDYRYLRRPISLSFVLLLITLLIYDSGTVYAVYGQR